MILAGCASLSERDCRTGDWQGLGKREGERGQPSQLERHREACAKHGVTVDEARYRSGHAEGLRAYCSPAGGYVAGREGRGYQEACAGAGEAPFLAAYRRGREVFSVLTDVRDTRRRIDELEVAAMSGEYAPEDRTQLRFRANELAGRLRLREMELERLDRRYAAEFGAPELSPGDLRY